MGDTGFLQIIIGLIVVLFIIFLIIRELNCWYWKINKRIELTKQTNFLLEKIYSQLGGVIKKDNNEQYVLNE